MCFQLPSTPEAVYSRKIFSKQPRIYARRSITFVVVVYLVLYYLFSYFWFVIEKWLSQMILLGLICHIKPFASEFKEHILVHRRAEVYLFYLVPFSERC